VLRSSGKPGMTSLSIAAEPQSLGTGELADLLRLGRERPRPTADFPPPPERIRQEIEEMSRHDLSPYMRRWAEGYARVGRRNPYLWTWCRQAVRITTLPCVEPALRDDAGDVKTLGVMFDVMLDDLADRGGDDRLLEELLALPLGRAADLSGCPAADRAYAEFTCDLWREIVTRCEGFPRYAEFARLLRFDYLQLCNVMRYSHLLNGQLDLLNLAEHDVYTPHNMHIMVCSTIDLMCSPSFDRSELGRLREVVWHAQWMGRIGNLVTTWQRELGEGDFTSGVYARAVTRGDVTVAQLRAGDRPAVEQAILRGGHEEHFLRRWRRHRAFLRSRRARLASFDVERLADGYERLICLHLGSRGYK
ncbi:MAG TPA: hypothetical protein VF170_05600, partial [Planctomycetaceae bacterium]